eukprot:gene1996-1711_t
MSFSQHFTRYKMKGSDTHIPEFVKMQRIINETRTMPIFHSLLQLHRQQQRQAAEARKGQEEARREFDDELRRRADVNFSAAGGRGAVAVYAARL